MRVDYLNAHRHAIDRNGTRGAGLLCIILDPYLANLLPGRLWRIVYLEQSPYRITPLALAAIVAVTTRDLGA